jgi:hypothetical protein
MEYQVKPLGKVCTATGKPLVPGSLCHSVLIEKHGEFQRLDYSAEGWQGPPAGALGVWKCQVPGRLETNLQFDLNALYRQFEESAEDTNFLQLRIRYVIAILLLSKRRLQLDDTKRDGDTDYLLLSGTRGEGKYEVIDLKLPADEIKLLQKELLESQQWDEEEFGDE